MVIGSYNLYWLGQERKKQDEDKSTKSFLKGKQHVHIY